MAIKLTGMASQMDTDSMVKELVSAYSLKKENYVKDKTKLDWQQEAWKDLNSKIYSFYTGALSKMKMAASFSNQQIRRYQMVRRQLMFKDWPEQDI